MIRKRVILKSKFKMEWLLLFKNRAVVFISLVGVIALLGKNIACGNVKTNLCSFPLIEPLHFHSAKTAVSEVLYLNIETKNANTPKLCNNRDC